MNGVILAACGGLYRAGDFVERFIHPLTIVYGSGPPNFSGGGGGGRVLADLWELMTLRGNNDFRVNRSDRDHQLIGL